jgi:predicted metalloprotease with PDZ domain
MRTLLSLSLIPFATAGLLVAQKAPATPAPLMSAPIANVAYEVTFNRDLAKRRAMSVRMTFDASGAQPVLLSLPAWTPGAYEITDFAKWVSNFTPTRAGQALEWDKLDYDTWRIHTKGPGPVTLSFDFKADTLDNAMSWARDEFLLFNGTNVFMYPEGQPLTFPATVRISTESDWIVATGMTSAGARNSYREGNYHDLVDMPFFVGRFDFDSVEVEGITVRLATYPAGSLSGAPRAETWTRIEKMWPPMIQAFGDKPFKTYTIMQIADSSYQGASGLEHQNSHVDVITPLALGNPFLDGLYAHEIIHAWNVKRLRPVDLYPYRYDRSQPTPWLWVSEGITDYYADLVLVRAQLVQPSGFYATTTGKINNVNSAAPVALEDASLSTWIHPTDGTGYLYYDKGSLAGLMLDIIIRDASNNRQSLDDVMRSVYNSAYKKDRGFTSAEWWAAVSKAAGGKSFSEFNRLYVDGRAPYPWDSILPLAGLRLNREPRLGVQSESDSTGTRVVAVAQGTAAALAGVKPGDYLVSVGDVPVTAGTDFGPAFRQLYAGKADAPFVVTVRRGAETLTLDAKVQLGNLKVEADPASNEKATRIRDGILTGKTGS